MTDMTDEERRILVEDLCCRLPFRPKAAILHGMFDPDEDNIIGYNGKFIDGFNDQYEVENVRLYLRPMGSMTSEEYKEYGELCGWVTDEYNAYRIKTNESYRWLLEHHMDFNGLIDKGHAYPAKEGMY